MKTVLVKETKNRRSSRTGILEYCLLGLGEGVTRLIYEANVNVSVNLSLKGACDGPMIEIKEIIE